MIGFQVKRVTEVRRQEPVDAQAAQRSDHARHHVRRLLRHRHAGHRHRLQRSRPGADQEAGQPQHHHRLGQAPGEPAGRHLQQPGALLRADLQRLRTHRQHRALRADHRPLPQRARHPHQRQQQAGHRNGRHHARLHQGDQHDGPAGPLPEPGGHGQPCHGLRAGPGGEGRAVPSRRRHGRRGAQRTDAVPGCRRGHLPGPRRRRRAVRLRRLRPEHADLHPLHHDEGHLRRHQHLPDVRLVQRHARGDPGADRRGRRTWMPCGPSSR